MPYDALTPFRRFARGRVSIAALELGDSLLRGSVSDVRTFLKNLEDLQPALHIRCDQDFVNAVMGTALVRLGEPLKASTLLTEYLVHARREQGNLLPSLARLAAELEIEAGVLQRQSAGVS